MLDMSERRKNRTECGPDEGLYVHSVQRRNVQSRQLQESTEFTLLPPRPRTYGETHLSFRGSELLGLQVQGFCCPLQQRPSSGRITHRVTAQSRGGADGSLTLLNSLKGRPGSGEKPAPTSKTGSRSERSPESGAPTVTDPVSVTAETPITPCNSMRQVPRGQHGAEKVSKLHLYLPSSLCGDEEQDAEAEEMRTSSEETSTQGSEVKPNHPNPSHSSQDQPNPGPRHSPSTPSDDLTLED